MLSHLSKGKSQVEAYCSISVYTTGLFYVHCGHVLLFSHCSFQQIPHEHFTCMGISSRRWGHAKSIRCCLFLRQLNWVDEIVTHTVQWQMYHNRSVSIDNRYILTEGRDIF